MSNETDYHMTPLSPGPFNPQVAILGIILVIIFVALVFYIMVFRERQN